MPGVLSKTHTSAVMEVNRAVPAGQRIALELKSPVEDKLPEFARRNLQLLKDHGLKMVRANEFMGDKLALCGAGPSLDIAQIRGVDRVWAANSAVQHLHGQGAQLDVALAIDQTPRMLSEWEHTPDVDYYIASTCDPELLKHLMARGRRVQLFHNAVGFDGEHEYYCNDWPPGFMLGNGATVVSRAIGLGEWQGFERIDIHGADCAFAADGTVHANGDKKDEAYGDPVLMSGEIDGRRWLARPDMLMDAVHLARRVQQAKGRIRLMGDTLPVALLGKNDEVLDSVMRRLQPGETTPNGD